MHPGRAAMTFRYADQYRSVPEELVSQWLKSVNVAAAARPPAVTSTTKNTRPGAYGELVYDEPPCVAINVSVGASADDRHNPEPVAIGPLTRRRSHIPDVPREIVVTKELPYMHIGIPLARLGWFYGGRSQPSIKQFSNIIDPALSPFGDHPLLRLPDPDAELLLYFSSPTCR